MCIGCLVGFVLLFHLVIVRIVRHIWKFPIPQWAVDFIGGPRRAKVQPPELMVEWMGIKPGMKCLEVGPGSGLYTFEVAKSSGEVTAIDIEPKVIERLNERASERGVKNLKGEVANVYSLPYPDKSFDLAYMMACLPEIPDHVRALKEIKRVLKDDGVYCDSELWPDPDYPFASTVVAWAEKAGLEKVDVKGNWLYYLLRFRKK